MVSLKKYWGALQNFLVSNSEPRKILIDLSQSFTAAAQGITPEAICALKSKTANSNLPYSIYACSKNLEIAGSTHTFLRLVNPQGEIECDIHGVKQPKDENGRTPLAAIIEPKDFEHFDHLSDNEAVLVWQGSAQEAGHKMRMAMALVERLNETKRPYQLLSQNCNTLLHSLLSVMDLKLPDMPRWAPGLHRVLHEDVSYVKTKGHGKDHGCSEETWLAQFTNHLSHERQKIINTFGSLAKAGIAASQTILAPQPKAA